MLIAPLVGGGDMFAVVFCVVTPACGSDISRCRIQLLWILSLCSSRAVSVKSLVGPGSVFVGCPLGSGRCDCGSSHYFTILMLITSSAMHVLSCIAEYGSRGKPREPHSAIHTATCTAHRR